MLIEHPWDKKIVRFSLSQEDGVEEGEGDDGKKREHIIIGTWGHEGSRVETVGTGDSSDGRWTGRLGIVRSGTGDSPFLYNPIASLKMLTAS